MGVINPGAWTNASKKLGISEDASFLLTKFSSEISDLARTVGQLQECGQIETNEAIDALQLLVNALQVHAAGSGADHTLVALLQVVLNNVTDKLYFGQHTTVGGGVSEDIAVVGLTSSHICTASMAVEGASPVSLKTAICGTDKITLTFSADPSSDHKINYSVIK